MLIREEYKLEPSDLWSILHNIATARGEEVLDREDIKFVDDLGEKDYDYVYTDSDIQRLKDLADDCEQQDPNLLKGFITEYQDHLTFVAEIDRDQILKVKPFLTKGF